MGFARDECAQKLTGVSGLVTEAWGQGFMVGGLTTLFFLILASLRQKVLLHKLIAIEVFMAVIHGTFIFVEGPAAGWYLSATAVLLYISYNLHNVINWIKIKPFLDQKGSLLYIGSLVLVWPYWIVEMWLNFEYNNNLGNEYFARTRPWEILCREPWWLFTTAYLLFIIQRSYSCGIVDLVRASPKFGILVLVMGISICFIIVDTVISIVLTSPCTGQNPFWKIALIFKCLADTIFLDDFKSVLDKLSAVARPAETFPINEQVSGGNRLARATGSGRSGHDDTEKADRQHIESVIHMPQQNAKSSTREWFDQFDIG